MKMARLLKNPKQTSLTQQYSDINGQVIIVDKTGYYFSDNSAMDKTVQYFKDKYGFVEEKKVIKNESKSSFLSKK